MALRSVPIDALEDQIRAAHAAFWVADEHAIGLEQSLVAARAAANAARAEANAKLVELGQLLARAKKQQRAESWESYLASLGIEHPQTAWHWMQYAGATEPEMPASEVVDHERPVAAPKGRPLRIEDDIMTAKVALSCVQDCVARLSEARKIEGKSQREKVESALEQARLAYRSLGELLHQHGEQLGGDSKPRHVKRDEEANRTNLRALYNQRVAAKQCVKCGGPALPNQVRCHLHRVDLADQQQRRKETL